MRAGRRVSSDDGDLVRVRYVDADGVTRVVSVAEAATVPFEDAGMARTIPAYRNQRHTPGRYWSATTGELVEYETFLESKWLTLLDFDPRVVGFATQPLQFDAVDIDSAWSHVPDVFARRDDGNSLLMDVKNPELLDDPAVRLQASRTARLCERLGWDYELVGEPAPQRWANVSWLAGYRRAPQLGAELIPQMLHLAREPIAIGELLGFMEVPEIGRPVLFHLCWQHRVVFDLDTPLRETTLVRCADGTR
jgi:hypothetical protein